MSKVQKMSMKQILDDTGVILAKRDISNICEDEDLIAEYLNIYDTDKNFDNIKEFLIRNEEKIDKEKLILCLYLNYKNDAERIEKELKDIERSKMADFKRVKLLESYKMKYEAAKEKISRKYKDIDVCVIYSELENGKISSQIISSREEFKKLRKPENKKLEKWKQLDKIGKDNDGMIYILKSLLISDLRCVMQDDNIGDTLRDIILTNGMLNNNEMSYYELENIRVSDHNRYCDIINSIKTEDGLLEIRKELMKNIRFIDIDRLLLLCVYRYEEVAEQEYYEKNSEILLSLIKLIANQIDNKNIKIETTLNDRLTNKLVDVEYSYKDLQKFIKRFIGNTYISKKRIEQAKQDLLEGKISLDTLETPIVNLLELNKDDAKKIMYYSAENFAYSIEMLGYNENQINKAISEHQEIITMDLMSYLYSLGKISIDSIVRIYANGLIDSEFIKRFSEKEDISSEINIQKINEKYKELKAQKEKDSSEEELLAKKIELYKLLVTEGKSKEKLEEHSNDVMYEIAEDFEDENDILFYYRNGLLILDTVAEWGGDSLVQKLYNSSEISMQDVENLYSKKLIKQNTVESIVLKEGLSDEKLVEYIKLGYITEDTILSLFANARIHMKDMQECYDNKIISTELFNKIESIDIKRLEEASNTHINEIEEINSSEFSGYLDLSMTENRSKQELQGKRKEGNGKTSVGGNKPIGIIDPGERTAFLKMLGFKIAPNPDMGRHPENSPFKNYSIYVYSDGDKIDKDSIILAEQFYKDKKHPKDGLENGSATYIMRYGDLCTLNSYQEVPLGKKEAIAPVERDGVVYRAYHNVKGMIDSMNAIYNAGEGEEVEIKNGTWALSVLKKIAYARAGGKIKPAKVDEQFEGYKYLLKKHSREEIMEILKNRYKVNKNRYNNKTFGTAVLELAKEMGYTEKTETEEMAIYNCLRTMYTDEELEKIAIQIDYIDNGILPEENKSGEITRVGFPIWRLKNGVAMQSRRINDDDGDLEH